MFGKFILTESTVRKYAVPPQVPVVVVISQPLGSPGEDSQNCTAISRPHVDGQIKTRPSQIHKKASLKGDFFQPPPFVLTDRETVVHPRATLKELGRPVSDRRNNPGLGEIFPKGANAWERQDDIPDISELDKQDTPYSIPVQRTIDMHMWVFGLHFL